MFVRRRDFIIGTGCIFCLAIILFVRSFMSFCWSDEALYMSEVHRLFLGERPLVDEWHPTQFFSVLLLPFYTLYIKINGDTEGIYLAARMFGLLLSFILGEMTMYVMLKRKKLPLYISISSGMLVMLYSRANIGGISYYNLFLFTCLMGNLIIYNLSENKDASLNSSGVIGYTVAGIFLGMAIITNPIFLVFYVLMMVGYYIYIKNNKRIFLIFLGTVLVGILYLIFLFSKITFSEVLYYLPFVLNDDLHKAKGVIKYLKNLYELFYYYAKYSCIMLCISCMTMVWRKNYKHVQLTWMRKVMLFLAVVCLFVDMKRYISSHMGAYVTFTIFGVSLCVLEWDKVKASLLNKEIWCFYILPALAVLSTFAIASATGDPMTEGFVILSLVTLVILFVIADKQIYKFGVGVICFVIIFFIMYARVFSVYRDAPLKEINTRIEMGPAKGLLTTKDHADKYMDCLETMELINSLEYKAEDTIIISKYAPWMYTATNIKNGAPYPFNLPINSKVLEDYYKTHEINCLKFVLILDEEYGDYKQAMNPEGTSDYPNKNELNGKFMEILNSDMYEKRDVSCGILYERKDI